ncbi:MAG: hypothetical protein AAGF81_05155 [Pseudomonadota bacterium]
MHTKKARLKEVFGKAGLILASLLLSYGLAGALFLVWGPAVAWRSINIFPTAATLPWQPSGPKSESEPYIAILGDSHAVGTGDWYAGRKSRQDPFYSGDVISAQLGTAVLSFGKNRGSSIDALVTNPARIMSADSCFLLHSPPPPKSLVVYVYEGNDFNNNLLDLQAAQPKAKNARDVQDLIATQSRLARDVPCYVQINELAINLISTVAKALFRAEQAPPDTSGQPVKQGQATRYLPKRLQGPALELNAAELDQAFAVLSQSLDHLLARFAGVPLLVVHLPSVLTPYRLLAERVTTQTYHGGNDIHARKSVRATSDALCERLRKLVLAKGADFLDARAALDRAAAEQMIHGPRDWKHLNRVGQTALGTSVANALTDTPRERACANLLP